MSILLQILSSFSITSNILLCIEGMSQSEEQFISNQTMQHSYQARMHHNSNQHSYIHNMVFGKIKMKRERESWNTCKRNSPESYFRWPERELREELRWRFLCWSSTRVTREIHSRLRFQSSDFQSLSFRSYCNSNPNYFYFQIWPHCLW